MKSLYSGTVRG